jgi:four helix bundle protein
MNPKAEALKHRTRKFMLDCLALCKTIERSPEGDVLRRQLAKSACGVAGNYRHMCRARSHAEFVAKIGTTLEEADESELWLGTIREARLSQAPALPRLCQESTELMLIFSQSSRTARSSRSNRDNP